MNEKQKATLIVSLIITLLAISLVWQGTRQHARILENQIEAARAELQSSISTMETFSFAPYRNRIKNVLETNPEISAAFAARDRQLLLKTVLPKYEALQLENRFFKIMHFHLPNGRTFLRAHKPDFHGDDLTLIRPMIAWVNEHHKPASGFEVGRFGPFYRVVEPIFHNGIYVGALEFGIVANQILDLLEREEELHVTTYFDQNVLAKAFLFDQEGLPQLGRFQLLTSNQEDLFHHLPATINFSEPSQRLTLAGRSYILYCRSIFKNFQEQDIGGILVLQDITETLAAKKIFLLQSIFFSALLLGMTLFVVSFYFSKVMGALLQEIKERKKSEEALRTSESRFRLLVHDLPNIAVRGYDQQRRVVLWNKGSELLYGYSQEEALGRNLEELIVPEEKRFDMVAAISGWLDLGLAIPSSECTLRHRDGSPVPVFSSHAMTYKGQGEPEIYSVDVNLRDLQEAQAKQLMMAQQLSRVQKMEDIGVMAGGVAHELNNILSGIVSYPELLLMQLPANSPMCGPLETIKDSGRRAAAVVADLLTVARGVAKATEVANPNNFIEFYLQSAEYNELCRCHPLVLIQTNLATDLKNIRCSEVHIMKVLTNLINNAAEAINGRGVITISSSQEQMEDYFALEHDIAPGEYSVLSICDDGPGLAEDDLNRIFEPFFTKKLMGRSGTGLGLTVVWNTMRDHGGVVIAASSPQGSCFRLYFPACHEEITLAAQETDLAAYQGNNETILVVDDDKQQRFICKKILTAMGYRVQTAASGEEAIDSLREQGVDLVVLDMIMAPGMNGKETYTRIRELHPGQKAIIASGFSQSEDVTETLNMGAGQYIRKPYTMTQLGGAVKTELASDR
ncbi:MAG: response regulator [Desulfurivibrionaceae bacterium]|nr:response regulator [Desulfurivibrionaceae bacterium]